MIDYIFTLDLGTFSLKAIAALPSLQDGRIQIVGAVQVPSGGMRRGVIIDSNQVAKTIKVVTSHIKNSLRVDPEKFIVNIGGDHVSCALSKGIVSVSRADGTISEYDVERVITSSRSVSLPPNREVVQVIPREFIVDGEQKIKQVIGMTGVRLEVESLIVYAFSPHMKTLLRTLAEGGIEMEGSSISSLAAAGAVLTNKQKEIGTILIDIGAQTTDFVVYEEGQPIFLGVLPIGSFHISNDIAIMLRVDPEIAERLKIEYGSCFPQEISKKELVNAPMLGLPDELSISRRDIAEIMAARLSEIFELVNKELHRIGKEALLPGGAVLIGGGAKVAGCVDFAKKELRLPVQLGYLQNCDGLVGRIDELQFATAVGLALLGLQTHSQYTIFQSTPLHSIGEKLKWLLESLLP